MKNSIKDKFIKGVTSIGTISHMKSAVAIEGIGASGMDYVMIDFEHSPVSVDEALSYITAADAAGITPIVRVNEISRSGILSVLDAGAKGVIIPGIENVEDVQKIIKYGKFQPTGERGYCMTRDGKWGFADIYQDGLNGYMNCCNENTLLIPQCETIGCLENIDVITAMDGVDGILIGPYDLSIAMGMPGQFENEGFKNAVSRILDACKKNKKIAMMFTGNADAARNAINQGFDSILLGLDMLVLINSYKAMLDSLQKKEE